MTVEPTASLNKSVALRHLFTLGIGTIVGVAWLMVLGDVLRGAGPIGAVIAFLIGGLCMLPIVLCYGELGSILPAAGGEVVYAHEIFGFRSAYAAGVALIVIYVINCVFFGVSAGWLVNELVPGSRGPKLYSVLATEVCLGDLIIGGLGTAFIAWVNSRGAHWMARLQDIATYTLLAAALVFVVVGFALGHAENLQPMIVRSENGWVGSGILAVLAVTPYFFGGFSTIPQALGELADPEQKKRVGWVLVGCILLSLIFYALVMLAMSMVLPRETILTYALPIPMAFSVAFGSPLAGKFVLLAGLLGLIAVWNALFFAATRVLFAMGRAGMLPMALGQIRPGAHAPGNALGVVFAISMLGLLLGRGVLLPVVNMTSTLFAAMYLLVTLGLLRLRSTRSLNETPPYVAPGGALLLWFAILFSAYLVVLSLYQQYSGAGNQWPPEWSILCISLVVALVAYRVSAGLHGRLTPEERRTRMLADLH